MSTSSKPHPGTAAAVLDSVIRSVAEGRYRYARLQLVWARQAGTFDGVVDLVARASAAPGLPPGMDPEAVVEGGRPRYLPSWLEDPLTEEIRRICSGSPLARSDEVEVVARVAGAVCIDVAVDLAGAADRVRADSTGHETPARARMIDADHVIDLEAEREVGSRPTPPASAF